MALFNQFSFVVAAVVIGLMLGIGLWRWQRIPALVRIGIIAAYVVLAGMVLISSQYPIEQSVETVAAVDALLTDEHPTFIMLYSNY